MLVILLWSHGPSLRAASYISFFTFHLLRHLVSNDSHTPAASRVGRHQCCERLLKVLATRVQ